MNDRASAGLSVLALALVVALTSCSGKVGDATAIVREAPDKTVEAGSARVAMEVAFTSGGTPSTVTGEGVVDLSQKQGMLRLDLGALAGSLGTSSVETFLSSEGIFVKLPASVLPGNRPWLKLNLAVVASQAGVDVGSLGQLQSADPSQALQFLKGAVDDMSEVGEEQVRGTGTTHYRGTLDLQRAQNEVSSEARPAVSQAIASLGTSRIPADVWIDDDGRMRKMRFEVDPDRDGPNPPGTAQFEMFDFGVQADIQPPPLDQVTDLSNVLGGLPR